MERKTEQAWQEIERLKGERREIKPGQPFVLPIPKPMMQAGKAEPIVQTTMMAETQVKKEDQWVRITIQFGDNPIWRGEVQQGTPNYMTLKFARNKWKIPEQQKLAICERENRKEAYQGAAYRIEMVAQEEKTVQARVTYNSDRRLGTFSDKTTPAQILETAIALWGLEGMMVNIRERKGQMKMHEGAEYIIEARAGGLG
jgi:hypothetical protein